MSPRGARSGYALQVRPHTPEYSGPTHFGLFTSIPHANKLQSVSICAKLVTQTERMNFDIYSHRYADIILNSDYEIKKEVEEIIKKVNYKDILKEYESQNIQRNSSGQKEIQGKQKVLNSSFKAEFEKRKWETEKYVFEDEEQDLKIDFWKRNIGVDVAFNHRSFIGGDLLRFQAAAEVKDIIKVGVYICAKKDFLKSISPKDKNSLVNFERTEWYLKNFYPVLTVPILLVGLIE